IVIPPHAPHSCNPLHGRPRSYHMLYLDATWCHAQRPDIPPGASITSPQPLLRDSPLFASFQPGGQLFKAPAAHQGDNLLET
ncbi:hypothetical protein ACQ4T2_25550, partial [Escherichia coli]